MKYRIMDYRFRLLASAAISCMVFFSCEEPEIPAAGQEGEKEEEVPDDGFTVPVVKPVIKYDRALWASINGRNDAADKEYASYNNTVLVSWRLYPGEEETAAFDIYRKAAGGEKVKLNDEPVTDATCWQDKSADLSVDNTYYLHMADDRYEVDSYTLKAERAASGLPYVSVFLKGTADVPGSATYSYDPNDISVGDLDGDGMMEFVIKRMLHVDAPETGEEDDMEFDASITPSDARHINLFEAYRLDGTFMWRIMSGPNIPLGNSASFAVCDFDGDGACEVALRTAEGTVFGDGKEIRDTNADGKTDYRVPNSRYTHGGPEFLSVVDGRTGAEIDRTDYIALGTSQDWGDDRYHRSSSYRIGAGNFSGGCPSIVIGRGCYAKIVIEAWDLYDGKLYKRWNFDTTAENGKYRDYEAQGYHAFRSADVDGDGFDEVVYGSCTIDHDGQGLNCSRLGHGDAIHVGMFSPNAPGLEIWSCYETAEIPYGATLRNGASGAVEWSIPKGSEDVGRCMIADIDPDSPGCEAWCYRSTVHSYDGKDLGYPYRSCNFGIWWTGSLNRQLLDGTQIDQLNVEEKRSGSYGSNGPWDRVFTVYRYDVSAINGSKNNPCYAGDFLGDWREEIIYPCGNSEIRIFSTWYPSGHRFPYLLSDHTYHMSAVNQNIGYNQPNHLGYYLGSDMDEGE